MSRWWRLRCWSAIHFRFNFSKIKSERLRESQREKERNTLREGWREHRVASIEHRSRGRVIFVLRSPIYDEGRPGERRRQWRRRDRSWVTGFGFGLCIGDFFFFLINTSVLCVWFAEFCVWFAFVLGFDLSASDDATWWDSTRRQRRDGFNFWFSVFFFFGWESVDLPWVSYL